MINKVSEINKLIVNQPVLILLPFAGGNSYSYKSLFSDISPYCNLVCPELSEANGILDDRFDIYDLVDYIIEVWIKPISKLNLRYLFFGHSMGSLLAFLVCRKIEELKIKPPSHLIISGSRGPQSQKNKKISSLPTEEFYLELKELGGVSEEMLESKELMEFFEPKIKKDFSFVEDYIYIKSKPLSIPISVFWGNSDNASLKNLKMWEFETLRPVDFYEFNGSHFFIFDKKNAVTDTIIKITLKL